MNILPEDIENIILDYKYSMELFERKQKLFNSIMSIRRTHSYIISHINNNTHTIPIIGYTKKFLNYDTDILCVELKWDYYFRLKIYFCGFCTSREILIDSVHCSKCGMISY